MARLILASKSPRRKQLLELLGLSFEVIPSNAEESMDPSLPPGRLVTDLSRRKAEAVDTAEQRGSVLIIAADTIVVHNGELLGQPADEEEAGAMLRRLSGSVHSVYTGVSLLKRNPEDESPARHSFFEQTKVTFATLTHQEIEHYVRSGSPLDKAGGYGIQDDWGAVFVSHLSGDYYNVVGFPLHAFYREMKNFAPEVLLNRHDSHDPEE